MLPGMRRRSNFSRSSTKRQHEITKVKRPPLFLHSFPGLILMPDPRSAPKSMPRTTPGSS
jgi:hypothetical protein